MTKRVTPKSVLLLAAAVLAAVPALPASAAEAPQAAAPAMALPTPPTELGQISYFAGDWTCKGQADASPLGPQHATEAAVHIQRDLGGFWYVGRYAEKKTAGNPHPMSFEMVMGYDAAAKAWITDGYDVFGGRSHETSSGWQGETIVFIGETVGGGGPAMPFRDTFVKKSESSMAHTGEIQVEGKWTRTDQETCTRHK